MSRRTLLPQPLERLIAAGRRPTPAPRVEVITDPTVPAWLLRVLVVATLAGALALVTTNRGQWLVAMVLLVGVAARPDGVAPALFASGLGLLLVTGPVDGPGRVSVLVFAVHLAIDLGALVGAMPIEGRVEWRVLARAAPGFLAVQAVAQVLALLGAWVAGAPPTTPWLPLAAAAGLAALAWVVTWQLRDQA